MRVLVFGGTGYIGTYLIKELVASGNTVDAFIRRETAADAVRALGANPVLGSLDVLDDVLAGVDAVDAVIWAAQLMLEDERRVVGAMLDRLKGSGKAFIFTGGTSLLSRPTNGDWDENSYGEDDPFQPRRQIAPRLEIENMVRAASENGFRPMCIRPSLVWGNGGSQIIRDFYHSAKATGSVCYIGRGLNVYTNVHVEDVAVMYRLMLERGVAGALYHAASGEASYGVMAREIARHLGVGTRSVTIEQGIDIWDKFMAGVVLCSCSKVRAPRARSELGWAPHEDRLDILEDCLHPAYAEGDRPSPSWVRTPAAN
ncbi:NAD-dependent epimerase/dehydratase family protein [Rhizorhabdus argentea]|uniref:NAD-dependent epimerase/dehydratase family protein n=1 Tax=Rhizorhabdus argentea TaxID=1387174 RepID=UPI0030EF9EC3